MRCADDLKISSVLLADGNLLMLRPSCFARCTVLCCFYVDHTTFNPTLRIVASNHLTNRFSHPLDHVSDWQVWIGKTCKIMRKAKVNVPSRFNFMACLFLVWFSIFLASFGSHIDLCAYSGCKEGIKSFLDRGSRQGSWWSEGRSDRCEIEKGACLFGDFIWL